MIQPLFSGMLAMLMAKFIINDLPHSAGLLGTSEMHAEAPKPSFFTHSTNKKAYELILQSGLIVPGNEYVPVSLDGGLNGVWGDYVFTFPLEVLQGKRIKPVFYLGTSDMIGTAEGPNFIIMDMTCIFATEVTVFESLDARQAKVSRGVLPLTPLTTFIQPAAPELKKHGRAVLEGEAIKGYSVRTLAIVNSYNQMLANTFGIDYTVVKDFAEEAAQDPYMEWEVWWK